MESKTTKTFTIKDKSTKYHDAIITKVVVTCGEKDLVMQVYGNRVFVPRGWNLKGKRLNREFTATLHNYRNKTYLQAMHYWDNLLNSDLSNPVYRIISDALKKAYHGMGLPLGYVVPILKDIK